MYADIENYMRLKIGMWRAIDVARVFEFDDRQRSSNVQYNQTKSNRMHQASPLPLSAISCRLASRSISLNGIWNTWRSTHESSKYATNTLSSICNINQFGLRFSLFA